MIQYGLSKWLEIFDSSYFILESGRLLSRLEINFNDSIVRSIFEEYSPHIDFVESIYLSFK
jgi:hypothetical protein